MTIAEAPKLTTQRKLNLGVLLSHPIQYFAPVYREQAKVDGIELTVLYRTRIGVDAYGDKEFGQMVKWDIPLLNGYKHEFLSTKNRVEGVQWRVVVTLFHNHFDVLLVHGYKPLMNGWGRSNRLRARHSYQTSSHTTLMAKPSLKSTSVSFRSNPSTPKGDITGG